MPGTIRAVGFDMDGTFLKTHVDYEKLEFADRRVLESHNIPFDEVYPKPDWKRKRRNIVQWLESHGRSDEFPVINREIDAAFTEVELEYVHEARPFPGSLECLRELTARGYRVGLLTRGSIEYADRALAHAGATGLFDVVMGRDSIAYDDAKPSPVAMREFAKRLGVEPGELLYVGDNITDWFSARDAGSPFAGVLTGNGPATGWRDVDPRIHVIEYAGDVIDLLPEQL